MLAKTAAACREAAAVIEGTDLAAARGKSRKPYLVKLLDSQTLSADSEIVRLAFDADVLRAVAEYLGCLPTLTYIDIWYSPNDDDASLHGSQLFHLDHEDLTQLKCFVYVEDVGPSHGPLRVVNASDSENLLQRFDYRTTEKQKQVPDEVFASIPTVTATGPRGAMLLVDTSRCFHAGSRGGGKPRFAIVYQFLTPYAFVRRSYRSRIPTVAGAARLHPSAHYLLRF